MLPYLALGISAAFIAYLIAGYPLMLRLQQGREVRTIAKDLSYRPTVTVVLCVRNGAEFLRRKLASILALDYPKTLISILVVSDGSNDETDSITGEFVSQNVRLICQPPHGKAAAINTALAEARGEILFFTDVRQALDPAALSHLAANFADPAIGAVSGEMRLRRPELGEQAVMDLYWRYEVWVRNRHSAIDSIMGATGCIYAMRRSLARPIAADTLSDDVMLPMCAFLSGARVVFEPLALAFDSPAVEGAEFRRKWRTLAGLLQAFLRLPGIFSSRNRMRFHFMSHKFGRLILPWLLSTMAISIFALPRSNFKTSLLAVAATAGIVALADLIMPKQFALRRLTSIARIFFTMNAAALLAVAIFFVPPRKLWKTATPSRIVTNP